jgi:hypothetical protein
LTTDLTNPDWKSFDLPISNTHQHIHQHAQPVKQTTNRNTQMTHFKTHMYTNPPKTIVSVENKKYRDTHIIEQRIMSKTKGVNSKSSLVFR